MNTFSALPSEVSEMQHPWLALKTQTTETTEVGTIKFSQGGLHH